MGRKRRASRPTEGPSPLPTCTTLPEAPTEEGRHNQLGASWAGASEDLGAVLGPLPLWPASLDQILRTEVSNSLPETDTHSLGEISEAPPLLTLKDSPQPARSAGRKPSAGTARAPSPRAQHLPTHSQGLALTPEKGETWRVHPAASHRPPAGASQSKREDEWGSAGTGQSLTSPHPDSCPTAFPDALLGFAFFTVHEGGH